MTQDPGRVAALEILLEAYEQLDLPEAAAEACGRLARLHVKPAKRAAALYRQAEILRTRLGDPDGALDAYLRSSDLDPRFVPSRLRLVDHFWARGDLDVVADLANDLAAVQIPPEDQPDLVARLTLATIPTPRRGRHRASPSPPTPPWQRHRPGAGRRRQSPAGGRGAPRRRARPDRHARPVVGPDQGGVGAGAGAGRAGAGRRHPPRSAGGAGAVRGAGRPARARVRGVRARRFHRPRGAGGPPPGRAGAARRGPPRRAPHRRAGRSPRSRVARPARARQPGARPAGVRGGAHRRPSRPSAAACRRRAPPSCAGSATCSARPRSSWRRTRSRPAPRTTAAGCAWCSPTRRR